MPVAAFSDYQTYLDYCRERPAPSRYYADQSTPFGGGLYGPRRRERMEECLQELRDRFEVRTIVMVEHGPNGWPLVRYIGGFAKIFNLLIVGFGHKWEEVLELIQAEYRTGHFEKSGC